MKICIKKDNGDEIENISIDDMGRAIENLPIDGEEGINEMRGEYVIIRTYSAGCWAGILSKKVKDEVILKDARRMYYWHAKEGISLSACALYGIKDDLSKIIEPVDRVWLQAIEIIPCTSSARKSFINASKVEQKR